MSRPPDDENLNDPNDPPKEDPPKGGPQPEPYPLPPSVVPPIDPGPDPGEAPPLWKKPIFWYGVAAIVILFILWKKGVFNG